MQCPVCTDVVLAISSREGVEIDYCPQCRGVWLDRGELDKILLAMAPGQAQAASGPPPAPAAPPRDERRYDDDRRYDDRYDDRGGHHGGGHGSGYGKKRRRGFLDDLFDF